jgi:hypothetical protein
MAATGHASWTAVECAERPFSNPNSRAAASPSVCARLRPSLAAMISPAAAGSKPKKENHKHVPAPHVSASLATTRTIPRPARNVGALRGSSAARARTPAPELGGAVLGPPVPAISASVRPLMLLPFAVLIVDRLARSPDGSEVLSASARDTDTRRIAVRRQWRDLACGYKDLRLI